VNLSTAPRAARHLLLLAAALFALPCLALAHAVLAGLRAEAGPANDVAQAALALALGLPAAGFILVESLAYLLGSRLVLPARLINQVARAGAARDFRRATHPGGGDEIGRLATACGRFIRHLTRRRHELDWLAADTAGQGLLDRADARAEPLLRALTRDAQFAAEDPEPAEAWLDLPLHRLLSALAAGAVVLAAAPAGPGWAVPVMAVALLGGRALQALRPLGPMVIWAGVALATALGWLTDQPGPGFALATALAASLAVHLGGGWRGPVGSAADAGWLRTGLAGAAAGAGAAVALLAALDMTVMLALASPVLLAVLGLAASCLAPPAAVVTPGGWPGPHAAARALRQGAARWQVLGGGLPAGLLLGTATGLALAVPAQALLVAVAVWLVLALPLHGVARRWLRLAAGVLLGAALLLGLVAVAGPAQPVLMGAAAALAWAGAAPAQRTGVIPQQVAILAALARAFGILLGMGWVVLASADPAWTPLLPALAAIPLAWPRG
jgi:hypothetical protein